MKVSETGSSWGRKHVLILLIAGCAALAVFRMGYLTALSGQHSRQAEVETRGAKVMPFDMNRTMHIFKPLPDGGLQTVTANDPKDTKQIALIQGHLGEEAAKFTRGDFSSPATIHGNEMPGLTELRAGVARLKIRYKPLTNGASIQYQTDDPVLVTALHNWFKAQVSDHGRHAMPGM